MQDERSLAQVVDRERGEDQEEPRPAYGRAPEMAHVGVEGLGSRDHEDHGSQRDERDRGMLDDEDDRIARRQAEQNGRVLNHHGQSGRGQHDEPQHHDRAEEHADLARSEALNCEEDDQDHCRDGNDQVRDRRHSDMQTFDGREHTDRRRDDRIAVEQRHADDTDHEKHPGAPGLFGVQALAERGQRHHTALTIVVGTHQDADVLDGHDDRNAPEHQRDHSEHVGLVRAHSASVEQEDRLQRVQRAGADIAEDDAQRGDCGHYESPRTVAAPVRRARPVTPGAVCVSLAGRDRHWILLSTACNATLAAPTVHPRCCRSHCAGLDRPASAR